MLGIKYSERIGQTSELNMDKAPVCNYELRVTNYLITFARDDFLSLRGFLTG
jgi:hypothetical protein